MTFAANGGTSMVRMRNLICCLALDLLLFVISEFSCSFLQLTYQLAEVQRQQKTSEATVRQLRTDLALAQKELGKCLPC